MHLTKCADRDFLADVADLKNISAEVAAQSEKCSKKDTPTDEWVRGFHVRNRGLMYRKMSRKILQKLPQRTVII